MDSGALDGARSPYAYRDLVRELRDLHLKLDGHGAFTLEHCFWRLVSARWVALDLLSEWLRDGDETQVRAAGRLLCQLPWQSVFELAFALCALIDELDMLRPHAADVLSSAVITAAETGMWDRSPGQSAPRWLQTRDKAREVAQRAAQLPAGQELFRTLERRATRRVGEDLRDDEEHAFRFHG